MRQMCAEWSAQIAAAIESAQILAWRLGSRQGASIEARELYSQLEAARLELESLRVVNGGPGFAAPDPELLHKLGWSSSLLDPAD